MTFIQAYKARATIALSGIASTIVVPSRGKTKTATLATTKTATTIPTPGKGDASPPYDVVGDRATENKGIDDAVKYTTMHEVASVNGWVFNTSNRPFGRACGGGGLNRAANTAASGGTTGGGGGPERRKGFARGGSFGGLACWAWVVPWVLLVLGGIEGVKGAPIPDKAALVSAVNTYTTQATIDKYGPIEDWNTSLVTDMSRVFESKSTFNANISAWQVGKVTTMYMSTFNLFGCFYFPSSFCGSTNSLFEQCSLLFFFNRFLSLDFSLLLLWCSVLRS
jgi:hypothetical protein